MIPYVGVASFENSARWALAAFRLLVLAAVVIQFELTVHRTGMI
jgi:hypothetical protein